jgi:hypothetical protein
MRSGAVTLIFLLCAGLVAWAEEKLPMLRVGTVVYSNVTVMRVTTTDVYFTFNKGMANAKLKNLDPVMQEHFNYDAAKAEAAAAAKRAAEGTPFSLAPASTAELVIDRSNAKAVREDAIARVKAIVNQPVKQFTQTPNMDLTISSPGWFHDGAIEPDYKNVDVRTSQKTHYGEHAYASSDLNPGIVFAGSDIEFNANTKFFYVDRNLPKKRLTEPEMAEINRLYRIIAKCGEISPGGKVEEGQTPAVLAAGFVNTHRKEIMIGSGGFLLLLLFIRFLTGRRAEG